MFRFGSRRFVVISLVCVAFSACNNGSSLKVEGQVTYQGFPAIDVSIHAVCGDKQADVQVDSNGKYKLDANVEGCAPLILEFKKESWLPAIKVVPVPAPTSPMTLDVKMKELEEVQCGSTTCQSASASGVYDKGFFSRGWVTVMSGNEALPFVAGDFRDEKNQIVWINGFGHFDFRDDQGSTIARFPKPFTGCYEVSEDAQPWLVDVDSKSTDTVELNLFEFDVTRGVWVTQPQMVQIAYSDSQGPNGEVLIKRLTQAQLPDVVSKQFQNKKVWACFDVTGSGWRAWGLSHARKGCVVFQTKDECDGLVSDSVIDMTGRGFGFHSFGWTNRDGTTCLDLAPSEPVGDSFDQDKLNGETFFIDFVAGKSGVSKRDSFESPRTPGNWASI